MSHVSDTPRLWMYGLTADEWLHLAAEGEDSEVQPCCGNLSLLREHLNALATCQEQDGPWPAMLATPTAEAYQIALSSHEELGDRDSFPLLHKVLDALKAEFPDQFALGVRLSEEIGES